MKKRIGLWFCRVMGWHPWRHRTIVSSDGLSMKMKCTRCGFVGLVDSQGNLF